MALLANWAEQIKSLLYNLFLQPDWHTFVDIFIIALVIYQLLKRLMTTRANSVIRGIVMVLMVTWLSEILQFNAINWLLQQVISIGVLLLIIVFQPEVRRALEQIGRQRWTNMPFFRIGPAAAQTTEKKIDELVTACVRLSRRKVGALIVMERSTGLQDVIESGTTLDAEISAPLLENIFEPNTPLHDGAVVIRGDRIVAAACILQLSADSGISRDLGTRHRAALGVSETADSISLIVSEETGIISAARDGKLTRYLDEKSLKALLSSAFLNEKKTESGLKALLRPKGGSGSEKT
ncbi:MAG: diadenylate cyclase CdaA [Eubacteriales bacterium]|nr:diadenylate cyclase CdaA [Eubacteriales bacterium]